MNAEAELGQGVPGGAQQTQLSQGPEPGLRAPEAWGEAASEGRCVQPYLRRVMRDHVPGLW